MNEPGLYFAIHAASGIALCLFFGLFAWTSVREGRPRAVGVSLAALLLSAAAWCAAAALLPFHDPSLLLPAGMVLVLAALFFLPIRRGAPLRIGAITERVDERDILFAREEYLPGTEKHEAYYARRPELEAVDDRIRARPELLAPGGRLYDPEKSEETAALFRVIEGMLEQVDGPVSPSRREVDPAAAARLVKTAALRLGADAVGIARLDEAFVYTHVGRGPEPWGAPIENRHAFAVAFAVEMAYPAVERAPRMDITMETAYGYLRGGQIAIALAAFIRALGWPARAHMAGSNYQVMVPPIAHAAGLGELGRMGYLVSPRFGARMRLGCVTTDLPLVPDRPVVFGVQAFCSRCRKCAVNCPSGAIPRGGKTVVRGVEKWMLDMEKCLAFWRTAGTDCGLCMKVCPFSHPPALVHDLVRAGIRNSPFARLLSVYGEDLFYGRRDPALRAAWIAAEREAS